MDTLLGNFRSIYSSDYHQECKAMAQTCDELRHLILFIHRLTSASADPQDGQTSSSIDLTNPFSSTVQDLVATANKYPVNAHSVGRGARRLMTSMTQSPIPSFSCRQIDPITMARTQVWTSLAIARRYHHHCVSVVHTLPETTRWSRWCHA